MDLNNNGVPMINPNDEVAFAAYRAACANSRYLDAISALRRAQEAAGGVDDFPGAVAVEGAMLVLDLASQALIGANAELARLVRHRRFRHIRRNMRNLGKVYRRLTKLSKQYGANFQTHRLSAILATRDQLIMGLRTEFEALYRDFSSIDPGALPETFVDLEERDRVFEDRSIYWFTLSADETKPWCRV